MPAEYLVLKKRGIKYKVKITGRYKPDSANIEVNMKDYHDFALFLKDLKILWGVPVDKAIEEYNKEKNKEIPFW